jgi:thymidine kinase
MAIQIYFGPMYSGKTTKLMEIYNQDNENKTIIDYNMVDLSKDLVYRGILTNHNNNIINNILKTRTLKNLNDIKNYSIVGDDLKNQLFNEFINSKHVYINEAQFYPDLKDFVLKLQQMGKTIYLFGLDSDYNQNKFGHIYELIPYAEQVYKMKGKCNLCDNKSLISHRVTEKKELIVTDPKEYIPLCVNCYLQVKIDINNKL